MYDLTQSNLNSTSTSTVISAELPVSEAVFDLRLADWIALPPQPLVTLRGLLGYALNHHLNRHHDARTASKIYTTVFKPQENRPHPFLIDCLAGEGFGDTLTVRLRFFGSAIAWLEPSLDALAAFGPRGFGGQHVPYTLDRVTIHTPECPWKDTWQAQCAGRFAVSCRTPVQLVKDRLPLRPGDDLLEPLARAAVRRFRGLAEAYGRATRVDYARVDALLGESRITRTALEEVHARRISSRSGDAVSIGGLQGRVEIAGPPEFERIFAAASLTGLGKKVAAGNGRVRVIPL